MNKFRNEEGLTLIELLITLAVIAIVFAIAVPVFSNVLAGAQTSADTAQAAALASFHDEYASTTLAFANGKTTATLNGVVIASIKGDATSAGAPAAPAYVDYVAGTDYGTSSMFYWGPILWMGHPADSSGNATPWTTSDAFVAELNTKAPGDTIYINGTAYSLLAGGNGQVHSDLNGTNSMYVNVSFPGSLAGTHITSIHF